MIAPGRARQLLLAGLLAAAAWGLVQALGGTAPLVSSLGLMLTIGAPLAFLLLRRRGPADISAAEALPPTLIAGLGLAICLVTAWRHGQAAGATHVAAGLSFIAWVVFARAARRGR